MFAVTGQQIPRAFSERIAEAKSAGLPSAPSVTLIWRPDRTIHLIAGLAGAISFPFFVLASVSSGLPFGIAAAFAIAHLAATAPSVGKADRSRLNFVLSALAAFWAAVCVLMVSAGFSPVSFLAESLVSLIVAAIPLISWSRSAPSDGRTLTEREISCLDAYAINEAVLVTNEAGIILGSTWATRDRIANLNLRAGTDILQFVNDADRSEFTAAIRKCLDGQSPQEICARVAYEQDGLMRFRMTSIAGSRIAVSLSPVPAGKKISQPVDPIEKTRSARARPVERIMIPRVTDPERCGPTNVGNVIDFAMRLMRQEADYAGLCVELKETDLDLKVACDRRTLIQIVVNVLGHAIKCSNFAGLVTVAFVEIDGAAMIKITDAGIGFSQDGEQTKGDGAFDDNGSVLATVDDLVREIGGSMKRTSLAGLGMTVAISLPIHKDIQPNTGAGANGQSVAIAAV